MSVRNRNDPKSDLLRRGSESPTLVRDSTVLEQQTAAP